MCLSFSLLSLILTVYIYCSSKFYSFFPMLIGGLTLTAMMVWICVRSSVNRYGPFLYFNFISGESPLSLSLGYSIRTKLVNSLFLFWFSTGGRSITVVSASELITAEAC